MVGQSTTLRLPLSDSPLTRALSPFSFLLTHPLQNRNKKKKKLSLPTLSLSLHRVTGFVCLLAACLLSGRVVLHIWAR